MVACSFRWRSRPQPRPGSAIDRNYEKGAVAGHAQQRRHIITKRRRPGRAYRLYRRSIEKAGAANEALGQLTPEVVDKLHEQRLFRLLLPRAYGGEEVDLGHLVSGAMEALAKLDASTAWCVGQVNGCA